ncbi:hypothetical protein pdam_00017440, partial [Pocillopora damicornis]
MFVCQCKFSLRCQNNCQLNVESNPGLFWFYLTLFCDWSRRLAPLFRPIRCKTNKTLKTWSPAFSRASSSLLVFILSSHWLMIITYEMISDSFETCAMLVWVTFALSESTGED